MRRFFRIAPVLMLALVAACETPAPPPPPPPPLLYLPREPALARSVFEDAVAFRQAMTALTAINADFADGAAVAAALRMGAAYEPQQLQQGAVAFVAIAALGQPDFVAYFRPYSIDRETREALAAKILEKPYYAAALPNADRAAGLAISALDAIGAKAWIQGRAVEQAAYTVQSQPWAKLSVSDRDLRLGEAKTLSGARLTPSAEEVDALRAATFDDHPISPISRALPGPYTDVVNRGLAIAALAALGEAGDDKAAAIRALLDEPISLQCLRTSKLMLYQCLAGSDRGHYEDMFCLGHHAIADPGKCVVEAAASPSPAFTPPPPPPIASPAPKPKPKAKASSKRAPKKKQ